MASAAGIVLCSEQQVVAPPPASVLLRRSANYQPSIWDYDSICSSLRQVQEVGRPSDDKPSKQLKYRVRQLLLEEKQDVATRLRIIDQLQRLGVAYHFEEEIKGIIVSMHLQDAHHQLKKDLSSTALLFRMLRGHGLPASTDVFSAFRDDSGGFRADHNREVDDIDGLISLYEASYLAFPGEAMLDEARAFAIKKLQELTPSIEPCLSERVGCVLLDLPLHWTPPRLQAIWSLKQRRRRRSDNVDSGEEESYRRVDPSILQLAAADFNLVQEVHRAELVELTEWWKETGLGEKLPFARDRLVECFFCAACIAPEPRRARCREVLAKAGTLVVHLDDVYDVYGTLDELAAFTDAIGGAWDDDTTVAALPEYMKAMYSAIRSTSTAAADRVTKEQGYDVLPLYKKAWRELCKAFLVEAKWQYESYKPGLDEYLNNGLITSTGPLLLLLAFPMLHETRQQQMDSCLRNHHRHGGVIQYPRMVELSSRIFRLCNDLATHETELERGDAPSAIACRMTEGGASEGEARQVVKDGIAENWKELNREACSVGGGVWSAASVNLARIIHCIYHDGDGITSPTDSRKQLVKDLLFNPIICSPNDR